METRLVVSPLWSDSDHSHVYILVIRPLVLAFFPLRMTVLNLSLWLLFNPAFAEKNRVSEMFSFGTFHHSQQSALPFDPVTRFSASSSIFPLIFLWPRFIVPSRWSAGVNQIDFRLITLLPVGRAHFPFSSCVFVEGFGKTRTLIHIHARLPCSPLICACVCEPALGPADSQGRICLYFNDYFVSA